MRLVDRLERRQTVTEQSIRLPARLRMPFHEIQSMADLGGIERLQQSVSHAAP